MSARQIEKGCRGETKRESRVTLRRASLVGPQTKRGKERETERGNERGTERQREGGRRRERWSCAVRLGHTNTHTHTPTHIPMAKNLPSELTVWTLAHPQRLNLVADEYPHA